MSRSIDEINDSILTEKETFSSLDGLTPVPDSSQTLLQDLSSGSKVSIWRLIFRVVAFEIFVHEQLFDQLVIDVEDRAKEIIPATTRFYVNLAKSFQLGDERIFDGEKFVYEDSTSVAALAKQIVTQASARDINQQVIIKVAKGDVGSLEKLSSTEKAAFEPFIDGDKIAGTKTLIITEDPDFLKVAYTIQFDPLVMRSDGTLIEDDTSPVQEAIDGYIQGLPFDSEFRVQDLTDAIQVARGVINAVADVVEAAFGAVPFTDILANITETYLPNAGYLATVDETGTEAAPVLGDINVLTPDDYDGTITYVIGSFARFEGIVFKSNVAIIVPEAFDPSKWDTVSNLTFISA